MLLLRNGQTLPGRINQFEDHYQVVVPGGEIRVKKSQVQCCCRDLREVCQQKHRQIRPDNIQDHLALAQWCQQAGLLNEAAEALADAAVLDPTHPMIPVLKRRLQVATAPPDSSGLLDKPIPPGPSTHDLDLMVRGMPPKTVEMFTQYLQPMLMNSCAAAACHGQSSTSGFRLLRMPPGSPPSRRLTQRNLYATLEWVDQSNPGASPLVTVPMRPHGTARTPIFTDHQLNEYRRLVAWCYRVAQSEPPAVIQAAYQEPAESSVKPKVSGRNAVHRYSNGGDASALPKPHSSVVPATGFESAGRPAERDRDAPPRPLKRGATVPKFAPIDPFDPETFNRQFAPPADQPPPNPPSAP